MQFARELCPVKLDSIKNMARTCAADRIYLHWSAGRYGQVYSDYHLSIDEDGKIYCPYNNRNLDVFRGHTYMRNTGSIGIALCAGYGAIANNGYDADMGMCPVTSEQIESMAQVVACICKHANIHLEDVMTHCEIAQIDGYGVPYGTYVKCINGDTVYQGDTDLRWDLWYLPDYDGIMRSGGDVIRGKAAWYMDRV